MVCLNIPTYIFLDEPLCLPVVKFCSKYLIDTQNQLFYVQNNGIALDLFCFLNNNLLRGGQIMINETEKEAVEKGMKTLWFVWAAITASLLIYFYIIYAFGEEIRPPLGEDLPLELLRNILYGISVIILFLAHFLRKWIIKSTSFSAQLYKDRKEFSNQPAYMMKYTAAVVASLAMSESIAIFGLVLFLIGADYQTFYIFLAISALGMFFFRPKRAELEELARANQPKPAF
jgi:hypothetical protein